MYGIDPGGNFAILARYPIHSSRLSHSLSVCLSFFSLSFSLSYFSFINNNTELLTSLLAHVITVLFLLFLFFSSFLSSFSFFLSGCFPLCLLPYCDYYPTTTLHQLPPSFLPLSLSFFHSSSTTTSPPVSSALFAFL